jgi:hypothetical protein
LVAVYAFLALLAGFVTVIALTTGMSALVSRLAPAWTQNKSAPQPTYTFVTLGYSFLSAAAGGYVTAWASAANPLLHVLVLGIVILAIAALSALQSGGQQPVWLALTLVALTPLGVLAGGLVRLRVLGIL